MKHAPLLALVAGSLIATQAAAQSQGLYARGVAELEYLSIGSDDDTGLYTNFTAGIDPAGIGSPWPLGVELSVEAFEYDNVDAEAIFATIFYDTSYGRWSLGIPAPVVDDYVTKPVIGQSYLLDRGELGILSRSVVRALQLGSDEEAFGLRYDGTFGATRLGVSVHDVDDFDAQVNGIAASFDLGLADAALGVEYLDASRRLGNRLLRQHRRQFGNFHTDLFASSPAASFDEAFYQVTLGYNLLPTLLVEAAYFDISVH